MSHSKPKNRAFAATGLRRLRRGSLLIQRQEMNVEETLEQALVDLQRATDGQGRLVTLFKGSISSTDLREATFAFMESFDPECCFINGFDPKADSRPAEAAAWRNLALLAKATAAAFEAGV